MKNIEIEIHDRINILQKNIDNWPKIILKLKEIENLKYIIRKNINEIKTILIKYERRFD